MKFLVEIDVMPHKELLDPQGKAVTNNMKSIGMTQITDVRIGKHITLHIESADEESAKVEITTACQKLFVNPVMESYTFTLKAV